MIDRTRREPAPDGGEESKLRYELRDALGMSPFDRDEALIREVKRLKSLEKQPLDKSF